MFIIGSRIENAKKQCTPLISAIEKFREEKGRLPKDLKELITEKYIDKIPSTGMSAWDEYTYKRDSETENYKIIFRSATIPFYFYSAAYAEFIYTDGDWSKTPPLD